MQLYFIRHGQSENNALWDEIGSNRGRSDDPELTENGHIQARMLAEFIAQKDRAARQDGKNGDPKRDFFGFTHLYTSLMVRAVATGQYISKALALPLQGWPEIHECGGIFLGNDAEDRESLVGLPGKTRAYFSQHYQDLILAELVAEGGWWNRPFEPYEQRPLRAKQVYSTLLERHGDTEDRVAIVSHGGFYMELMRVFFGITQPKCWFLMNNTAVSRFDFRDGGEIALIYHNTTAHLPDHLIT